jgi:translocation and assembly module TamB
MTKSPNSNNQSEPGSNQRLRFLLLIRTGIALGIPLLAGVAGGAWWLWVFVQKDLAPLVQKNLTQTLKRPVQLGRVERFSLTGLRFGPTSVPATPTDPDRASVKAVEVGFNPLHLVFTRTLKLNVTLVQPDVYIEQDAEGNWLSTIPAAEQKPGLIKTELDTIQFNKADVALVPHRKTGNTKQPFKIAQVNGSGQLLDQNQLIVFYLNGQPVTGGTVEIQGESRFKAQQTNLQLQGQNLLASDVTRLVELPIDLQAGRADGNLTVQLRPKQQPSLLGTVDLKAVTAQVNQLPQPFINTQGTLRFKQTQIRLENVSTSYGKIPAIANGVLDTQANFNLTARVNRVTLAKAQDTLKVKSPVPVTGVVRADLRVTGPILKPILSGTVATTQPARIDRVKFSTIRSRFTFSSAAAVITLKDIQAIPAAGGQIIGAGTIKLGQEPGLGFDMVAENVPGDAIARLYGVSPQIKIGTVSAKTQVSGTLTNLQTIVNWQAPQAIYPARGKVIIAGTNNFLFRDTVVNVAGGTVRAVGQLANGRWQASGRAVGVQLRRLAQVPPALQTPLSGTFKLSGTTESFNPETIRANGSGRVNIAGGTVTASNIQLAEGRWQGSGTATGIQLGRILPQLPSQLQGRLNGRFNLSGSLAAITPETVQGNGSGSLQVADGTVTATNVTLRDGRWQGSFAADKVEMENLAQLTALSRFSPQLQGRISGSVNASGPLTAFNVAAIQAKGQLRLLDFAANGLDFDPVLSGELSVFPRQGVNLHLAGVQDRISLVLSPTYRPVSFFVRRDEAIVTGRSRGDLLLVRSDSLPISIFKTIAPLPPALASQPVSGELSGNLAINLNTFAVEGNVAIARPAIGTIKGDSFLGQLRYANGAVTLTDGEFTQGESRYALAGSISQSPNGPQFQGKVKIAQGQVQNVLTALQLYDLQDFRRGLQPPTYARASVVQTVPVGLPNAPLLTQLRRFSEIEALLQQQRSTREQSPLPQSLADLKGTFDGEISVSGSLKTGVAVKFDLQGQNWQWDTYKADQIIAQGSFENGVLTLLPLRIESDETLVALNAQVGGTEQSGQLRVRNFPLDILKNFVKLPVDLTGQLNATATLGGSKANPQAIGELTLVQGTLNQKPVESAQGSFSYSNARLNFGSSVMVSGPDPIAITGSVPYLLPFAAVKPDSDQIRLDVNVQNEGLALLNLLTNQVAWRDGQGQVQVQVRGTLEQPVATGIATVNNATISAQALPELLTDVTGTVQFNRDRIQVEGVQGKFSRGNVQARGVIPIFTRLEPDDPDRANPLTVTLDQLALNLNGLYRGGVNGNVEITGSALNPIIGGEVQLARGQVSLPESGATAPTPAAASTDATSSGGATKQVEEGAVGEESDGTVPELNNLRLTLGEGIQITRPPVLNFQATGSLTLNGNRNDLSPDGVIKLRRGGINLFTTQFVLDRDNQNTATFSPNQGLDPNLDIELVAAVPEVTQRRRVPDSSLSSEINQPLSTELGALETVRVQARVTGPASQLFDNLELTSDPARSESEIIALLGGGFVNTLGRGDSTLGFANLASSALLGNFQGTVTNIGNAFGLSELRLFPTVITSERSRTSSTLGLAAEAGINISRNVSISILRVLTADQPTQFGFNYRVNDTVRLRTSTDLSGDSRAVVEYENRF